MRSRKMLHGSFAEPSTDAARVMGEGSEANRVLHLSAVDHGGAGTAALRLHSAMRDRGVVSRLLVWESRSGAPDVEAVARPGTGALRRLFGRIWYRFTTRRSFVFRDKNARCVSRSQLLEIADRLKPLLIVVHYISDFMSFADISLLQQRTGARIVFNLLDMGLLTGGCHVSWDCEGYRARCASCPALPGRVGTEVSEKTLMKQLEQVENLDHVVVVPTSQLAKAADGATLFSSSRFERILIGVDPDRFGQATIGDARDALGLERDGSYLFFGSQDLADPRKGMHLLLAALQELDADGSLAYAKVRLLVAGKANGLAALDRLGSPVHSLGFVDPDKLALAYCAADFFVCPSIEDYGPMMINEAMMSGTPVVGFPIGVLPDLVVDGETGLLATSKDVSGLTAALKRALAWNVAQRTSARKACRDWAVANCSYDTAVRSFIALA